MEYRKSLDHFIRCLAKKISKIYPNRCADYEDYIQAGHLKLAELQHSNIKANNFRAYAIVSISRAMRDTAIDSMCLVHIPRRVKVLAHKVSVLLSKHVPEKEICDQLNIDKNTMFHLLSILNTDSVDAIHGEPSCEAKQFDFLRDIFEADEIDQDDKDTILEQLDCGKKDRKLRNKLYYKIRKLRHKFSMIGYNIGT